jgi:hypothetical protein
MTGMRWGPFLFGFCAVLAGGALVIWLVLR